jgi:multicomponent Na+:H+ antiporter subunit D
VSGLPPFSGFWPKAMLVRAALDLGRWWLAAALLLSGFLVTLAAGRIFLFAFWRPALQGEDKAPALRLPAAVLACLAASSLAAGLWPEPLAAISTRAASGLMDPDSYIRSVFTEPRP